LHRADHATSGAGWDKGASVRSRIRTIAPCDLRFFLRHGASRCQSPAMIERAKHYLPEHAASA
jgi:hypothetical protein